MKRYFWHFPGPFSIALGMSMIQLKACGLVLICMHDPLMLTKVKALEYFIYGYHQTEIMFWFLEYTACYSN